MSDGSSCTANILLPEHRTFLLLPRIHGILMKPGRYLPGPLISSAYEGYHPFPITKTPHFICCRSLSLLALSHLFVAGHHNVTLPFLRCLSLYPVLSPTLLSLTQPFLSHIGIITKPCLPFKNIYSRTNPSRLVKISFCHILTRP